MFCTPFNVDAQRRSKGRSVSGKSLKANAANTSKTDPLQQRRVETLDAVWTILHHQYFDTTYNGHNWTKVYQDYYPRIEKAKTDDEAHEILEEMVTLLGRSHFAIIPTDVFESIEQAKQDAQERKELIDAINEDIKENGDDDEELLEEYDLEAIYGTGIEVKFIDGKFLVFRVDAGSAADSAGIKVGHSLESVNGVLIKDVVDSVAKHFPNHPKYHLTFTYEMIKYVLTGDEDDQIELVLADGQNKQLLHTISLAKVDQKRVSLGANHPESLLSFRAYEIDDKTGYIGFNLFALPVVEKFCDAIGKFKNKEQIVIDLRDNSGGLLAVMSGLSGMLNNKETDLGTSIFRSREEKNIGLARKKRFDGKIVILTNGETFSAGEIFAAAMQESGRAVIVGETTGGQALPAINVPLPTKAVFMYPIANFKTSKGKFLEGVGLKPDVEVKLNQKSLLDNNDLQLAKAVETFADKKFFPGGPVIAEKIAPEIVAEVTVKLPPVKTPPPPPPAPASAKIQITPPPAVSQLDKTAKDLIYSFILKIGGAEKIAAVKDLKIKGNQTVSANEMKLELPYESYLKGKDAYLEVSQPIGIGELRTLITKDGGIRVQSATGYDESEKSFVKPEFFNVFLPMFRLVDVSKFKKLEYNGQHIDEISGRNSHVITGFDEDGSETAMTIDVETGMLATVLIANQRFLFADYRKTGDLLLPYQLERGRSLKLSITEIEINGVIDDKTFLPKEYCFDKP